MVDLLSGVSRVISSSRSLGSDTAGSGCLIEITFRMLAAAAVHSSAASANVGAGGGTGTESGVAAAGTADAVTAATGLSSEAITTGLAVSGFAAGAEGGCTLSLRVLVGTVTFSCEADIVTELPAVAAVPCKESKEGVLAADAGLLASWIATKWVDPASGASEELPQTTRSGRLALEKAE